MLCQQPRRVRHALESWKRVDVHDVRLAAARDQINAVQPDSERAPAAQRDLAHLVRNVKRLAQFVFQGLRRPHPAHAEDAVADDVEFVVASVRLVITLREDHPVFGDCGRKFVFGFDDLNSAALRGGPEGFDHDRSFFQQTGQLFRLRREPGFRQWDVGRLQHFCRDDLVAHGDDGRVGIDDLSPGRMQYAGETQRGFGPRFQQIEVAIRLDTRDIEAGVFGIDGFDLDSARPEQFRGLLHYGAGLMRLFALRDYANLHRVETRLGEGALSGVQAAMTTLLPAAMNGTARLSLEHKTLTVAMPAMPKILVAVANEDLANLLQRGLEVENYLVDRAQDGREALQRAMARSSSYQLLILDALLEHKSGFDICREMRKSKRETPVILLGGRQGVEDKIEALQSGADDFLSKRNLVFEELMAKIDALLR